MGVINLNDKDFEFKYSKHKEDGYFKVYIKFTNHSTRMVFRCKISLIIKNKICGIINFYTIYFRKNAKFKLIDYETYLTFFNSILN